jgi:hypothetical protein
MGRKLNLTKIKIAKPMLSTSLAEEKCQIKTMESYKAMSNSCFIQTQVQLN